MGGTFLATPVEYQYGFIKDCYDALNGAVSASLEEAQRLNQGAVRRCVGLCIETRPDVCGEDDVRRMLDFGATRVELGVQTMDDAIYEGCCAAIPLLMWCGRRRAQALRLQVYYTLDAGLPGSSPQHDRAVRRAF
jgi:elongator complex protein 3